METSQFVTAGIVYVGYAVLLMMVAGFITAWVVERVFKQEFGEEIRTELEYVDDEGPIHYHRKRVVRVGDARYAIVLGILVLISYNFWDGIFPVLEFIMELLHPVVRVILVFLHDVWAFLRSFYQGFMETV